MDTVSLAERALAHLDGSTGPQGLFDILDDDVTWKTTIPAGTPLSGEIQGKRAVIDYFRRHDDIIDRYVLERPLVFFANGNCVVATGEESYRVVKSGVQVRNKEFAVVLDFRDGLITRVLNIKDAHEFTEAYRTADADANIALAKRALGHLEQLASRHDRSGADEFFRLLANDVVFKVACAEDTPVYGGEIRGKAAVVDFFSRDSDHVTEIVQDEPLRYFAAGDQVVALGRQSYTFGTTTVRGREYATVLDVCDGRITRVLSIEDVSEWTQRANDGADNVALVKRATVHMAKPASERALADYEPLFELLAEDVELVYSSPDGAGDVCGKQGVRQYIEDALVAMDDAGLDVRLDRPLEFFGNGNRVVFLGVESYTHRDTSATTHTKRMAYVLDIEDGLIGNILRLSE